MGRELPQPAEQNPQEDIFKRLYALSNKANLNAVQLKRFHDKMAELESVLAKRDISQLVAEQDVVALEKYNQILGQIMTLIKTKELEGVDSEMLERMAGRFDFTRPRLMKQWIELYNQLAGKTIVVNVEHSADHDFANRPLSFNEFSQALMETEVLPGSSEMQVKVTRFILALMNKKE